MQRLPAMCAHGIAQCQRIEQRHVHALPSCGLIACAASPASTMRPPARHHGVTVDRARQLAGIMQMRKARWPAATARAARQPGRHAIGLPSFEVGAWQAPNSGAACHHRAAYRPAAARSSCARHVALPQLLQVRPVLGRQQAPQCAPGIRGPARCRLRSSRAARSHHRRPPPGRAAHACGPHCHAGGPVRHPLRRWCSMQRPAPARAPSSSENSAPRCMPSRAGARPAVIAHVHHRALARCRHTDGAPAPHARARHQAGPSATAPAGRWAAQGSRPTGPGEGTRSRSPPRGHHERAGWTMPVQRCRSRSRRCAVVPSSAHCARAQIRMATWNPVHSAAMPVATQKPRRSGVFNTRVDHSAGVMFEAWAPFGPWVTS